ncbi:uncharacterized protein MFS17 isoform X9 [Drosophila takahashii]|uniref:uncharacterized protein MFS17 isoform X9 n=1 Tax=Drosophila takahashii TaxID=29030 RepID=UPI003898D701
MTDIALYGSRSLSQRGVPETAGVPTFFLWSVRLGTPLKGMLERPGSSSRGPCRSFIAETALDAETESPGTSCNPGVARFSSGGILPGDAAANAACDCIVILAEYQVTVQQTSVGV